MQRIESLSNAKIKRLKSLHKKKVRSDLNLFLVEGKKMVDEAILSSFTIEEIYISDSFKNKYDEFLKQNREQNIYIVKDFIFNKISSTIRPQGIIAVIKKQAFNIDNYIGEKSVILLDQINDPGNLGTIIRTADAFNIGFCLYTDNSVDIYNEKVIRATMGSIFRVPYIKLNEDIIKKLKSNNYTFLAMTLDGNELYSNELTKKSVITIGNEAHGISDDIVALCDKKIKIKMSKNTESLNAAIAAAIIMYEISKL